MANEVKYELLRFPDPRNDGSGGIDHDIQAIYRESGTQDPFIVMPNHHKTITVPYADLSTVMDMNNGASKVQAYKNLLIENASFQPIAYPMPTPGNWKTCSFALTRN